MKELEKSNGKDINLNNIFNEQDICKIKNPDSIEGPITKAELLSAL